MSMSTQQKKKKNVWLLVHGGFIRGAALLSFPRLFLLRMCLCLKGTTGYRDFRTMAVVKAATNGFKQIYGLYNKKTTNEPDETFEQ